MRRKSFLESESFRELYPFEGSYRLINGRLCHYIYEGNGEPVVLLHGNPSWSFLYRGLIRSLRDRYRLVAPDHIGCGLSEKPDGSSYSYSLKRRVSDVEALLDELSIHARITLVLHDWGGLIGMAYAARRPERWLTSRARSMGASPGPFPWRPRSTWRRSA